MKRFYLITRDLHLYLGLFVCPFILLFAISVFFLVHPQRQPAGSAQPEVERTVTGVYVPTGIASLQGTARVDALRPVLDQLGVAGEVDFIRHVTSEHRLLLPVRVPGRETTVSLDYERWVATISARAQPLGDVLVYLHKTRGPHNADIRGNSLFMAVWRVLTDATVYVLMFITVSGIYLWVALKAARRIGLTLMLAGACTFFVLVCAIAR